MSMTKKDFEGIAAALNKVLWMRESDPMTVTRCTVKIATYCQQTNSSFDLKRFQEAVFAPNRMGVPFEVES